MFSVEGKLYNMSRPASVFLEITVGIYITCSKASIADLVYLYNLSLPEQCAGIILIFSLFVN